jgi:hypothetical protein
MWRSDLSERLTFSKATIAVAILAVGSNAVWYLLGKPTQRIAHGASAASPSILVCDLIFATIGIVLILKYRTRHYRLLVIPYAMLLANALTVFGILIFHRW